MGGNANHLGTGLGTEPRVDLRAVHGVRIAERALPQRRWADRPDNAFTWFFLPRGAQPPAVFVVVPKEQVFDGHGVTIDVSLPRRSKAVLLHSRAPQAQCIGYWTEAGPCQKDLACTLELEDRGGWSSGVVVLNPRTAAVCAKAAVKELEGGRAVLEAPPSPQPLLLLPQGLLQKVTTALGAP